MGKRKRRTDQSKTPPPSEVMPYSSRMDSHSKLKSSHSVDSGAIKPLSSLMDLMDNSVKLSNAHHSPAHHHQNLGRAVLLRHPHHYYGRQYYRRKSANNAHTSNSRRKGTPLRDEKVSFSNSEPEHHTESREKANSKPERIRSGSLATDAVSSGVVKMVCGLCQKLLRRKPYIPESALTSSNLSVVAVLVCGHAYHADCLEQRTSHEDRRDPPCPLCVGSMLSQV